MSVFLYLRSYVTLDSELAEEVGGELRKVFWELKC